MLLSQNLITGTVTDLQNKNTIPGVNIYIPDLQKGTVTDANGYYIIKNIPTGLFKVQFSFIGYKTDISNVNFTNTSLTIDKSLQPMAIQTQEIIVTGGQAQSQHENAIKIESFSKESLDNSTSNNIIQKLSVMPGIDAISKGNNIATPVIRGLSTSNIVVLNNGNRLENYQFSYDHPYAIDEGNVSKVEVIKGPASLLYGSDAVGGVLNFIKEPPAQINITKITVNTSFSSNDKATNTGVNFAHSDNNYFGGASVNVNSSKDYYDGTNTQVPNTRSNTNSIKLFNGYRNTKGVFVLNYDYNRLKLGVTNPPSVKNIINNERSNDIWFQNLDNHLLASNNTLFFEKLKLDIDLTYQNNNRKLQGFSSLPDSALVSMCLQTITWQVKGKYDFSENNNLIVSTQGLGQSNINNNAPVVVLPDYSTLANSLAVLWQYSFNDKLFYQLGLRYDYKQIISPTQINESSSNDTIPHFNETYSNVSFSTGLTYKLSHHLLLRGNIASAYRTPSVAELLQDGVHGNRYEQGNRNFTPQRNVEVDASLHFHNDKFVMDIATFYNRIFDYIYLAPTDDTDINGLDIFRYNQNNAEIYGLEFFGEYILFKGLKINTTFAHIYARQDNGEYLPFIPQDKVNMNIILFKKMNKLFRSLQVGVNPLFAAKQNNPHLFESKTDSYFLLNGFVKTIIHLQSQEIELGIYAQNILNTTYYDHLSTLKDIGYYNMGRNISLRLKMPININN